MYRYKLTIKFSDGEVISEIFRTEQGVEGAIQGWKETEATDRKNGETYSIVSFETEEWKPAEA